MGLTSRARKLTKQSPAKERAQARAIFANAGNSKKAEALGKTLMNSARRKSKGK
jgi:hypothetical protein